MSQSYPLSTDSLSSLSLKLASENCLVGDYANRGRKMNTNSFSTNFLNTHRGLGHPGKIPGTYKVPLFNTQGRQTFEGGHELFRPPHLRVEDPHPTRRSPDPKSQSLSRNRRPPEGMIRKMTWFWSSDFFYMCSCGGLEADSKWRCACGHVTNVLGPFNVRAGWYR